MGTSPSSVGIRPWEITERLQRLLPSQKEFLYAPERFATIAGGYASGKTRIAVTKGIVLSAALPGNDGMFLCFRGTDVDVRLIPMFFELCPESWIRSYNKKDRVVVLRNGSVIRFQHLHDAASSTKTRRIGANLGWFCIDQMEECQEEHWNAMISRLRLPRALRKFGFGTINPNGHDWIWQKFFQGVQPWPKDGKTVLPLDGKFYQSIRRNDHLGIAVNSEENRQSNGGFVEDIYYDSLQDTYSEDYLNRYMYCSFDEFSGKLYKDYEAGLTSWEYASVHNIKPFPGGIPPNWRLVVGIDPGGDSPWGVVPTYIDEYGNLIVVNGFTRRTARVIEPVNWIKQNLPYDQSRTMFVIDWENKVVMVEMNDHGIYCQPANKDVMSGILRVAGYMHVQEGRKLPDWYESTQPKERWLKFRDKGSPRVFVMEDAWQWRKEHDTAKWNPDKPDLMWKSSTERFDQVDAFRYVVGTCPEPSKIIERERDYVEMMKKDPMSAREWKRRDRKLAERKNRQSGAAALRDLDSSEEPMTESSGEDVDWGVKGEI